MSKYTTKIKNYIDYLVPAGDIHNKINNGSKIFFSDISYPILPEYKDEFQTNFIRHFYMREIGCETIGLFKYELEDKLNIIIPYYNDIWESMQIEYNPLESYNLTEDTINNTDYKAIHTNYSNENTSSSMMGNDNTDSKTLHSDLPQSDFGNNDYGSELEKFENNSKNSQTKQSNNKTNGGYDSDNNTNMKKNKQIHGNLYHTYSELIIMYRKSLIEFYDNLLNEFNDLFMLLY